MSPSPNRYHQEISRNLEFILLKFLEHNSIGELFHSPLDVYLSEHDVFQPDIVYVANDRLSILADAGLEGAPTLVVEILSASTAVHDRTVKKQVYARSGVQEMWMIDPAAQTLEIYLLAEDANCPKTVVAQTERFRSVCFPGLEICAGDIFRQRFAAGR